MQHEANHLPGQTHDLKTMLTYYFSIADRREFIKISQAVGMGFLIMGAIGYFIKLSKSISSISDVSNDTFFFK